jgi:uncharacterized protein YbjQ (UPF0145 family)
MRKSLLTATLPLALAAALHARDNKLMVSVAKAMSTPQYQEQMKGSKIQFAFGTGKGPQGDSLGMTVANRKTNALNKTDEEACQWVFLSCMTALRAKAEKEGADAVVDIESYYKKESNPSDSAFECHAGSAVAGVALRGTLVKTKK